MKSKILEYFNNKYYWTFTDNFTVLNLVEIEFLHLSDKNSLSMGARIGHVFNEL